MHIELDCPRCQCSFSSHPDSPASDVLDKMTEQGPWFALGDGETFEDMIYAALKARGAIYCPECGDVVLVNEESLGRVTQEMLAGW